MSGIFPASILDRVGALVPMSAATALSPRGPLFSRTMVPKFWRVTLATHTPCYELATMS